MIKLLTYPEIDRSDWQALIDHSPYATWFQTKEAYEFYAANPTEMTPFAYSVKRDEKLRALCVGYITQEQNALRQLFTRRAIIIGGPVIADDATQQDVKHLLCAIKTGLQSQAIYIETRNFHDYSSWKDVFFECGFDYIPHLNFHVDCTKENILESMSESRRRQIKKALKNGVEIVEATSDEHVQDFYLILEGLYHKKVKTPLFPLSFFMTFYHQHSGKYLLVKYNDKIIGGIMCPILERNTIYEWFVCGLDDMYKNLYPSVMATYAAIEFANQHNILLFDFMGAGKPDEAYGVRDFKARFGGEQVEYGRFLCICKSLLYWIGKNGVKLLRKVKV